MMKDCKVAKYLGGGERREAGCKLTASSGIGTNKFCERDK
jgi:hypothetical protein